MKPHNWVNQNPGFRCSDCELGWWGDSNEARLPECGSEEALEHANWQMTEGRRRDAQSLHERIKEAAAKRARTIEIEEETKRRYNGN